LSTGETFLGDWHEFALGTGKLRLPDCQNSPTASGKKRASQPVAGPKSVAKLRSLRVASFGVGTGVTTYVENIGVVAATKVYSSRVVLQSKRSTFSAIRTVALWLPSVCGFDIFRKHLGRCCSKECSSR
jgi:hypothetical protein